ncbi:DUF86 domain-containing protein [Candidatus Gracilibacteria bacterium]|jgi:uncharacterized protein with HEPN domain|nr:DUF86 domain-containing protein [Candidatus Gracilibacteria bacterium]
MPKRDLLLYINDIYDSCNKILKYTKGYDLAKFEKDEKTMDAIIRNLEIIGEAAKAMPTEFRKIHKNIPWKEIAGMRDKITHEYFGVDDNILWTTVQNDVPALKKEISKIKKDFKTQPLF